MGRNKCRHSKLQHPRSNQQPISSEQPNSNEQSNSNQQISTEQQLLPRRLNRETGSKVWEERRLGLEIIYQYQEQLAVAQIAELQKILSSLQSIEDEVQELQRQKSAFERQLSRGKVLVVDRWGFIEFLNIAR